jgi:putative ABC transport system permease protein
LSHIRFEALVSLASILGQKADADGDLLDWKSIYSNYVYLTLPENANLQVIQASLDKLSAKENAAIKNQKINLSLQPLTEIALGAAPYQRNRDQPSDGGGLDSGRFGTRGYSLRLF